MDHSVLIHSFIDGHQGCLQHVAIVNCAAMNIGFHRFFWIDVSGLLGYNSSNEVSRSKSSSILVLWGNSILFSNVAAPVCIPTNAALGFPFLHILSNTCLWWPLWLVWDGISLWFQFASLWWLVMLSIFSYASGPSVCPLWRSVCSSPLPIF